MINHTSYHKLEVERKFRIKMNTLYEPIPILGDVELIYFKHNPILFRNTISKNLYHQIKW